MFRNKKVLLLRLFELNGRSLRLLVHFESCNLRICRTYRFSLRFKFITLIDLLCINYNIELHGILNSDASKICTRLTSAQELTSASLNLQKEKIGMFDKNIKINKTVDTYE